MKLPASPVLLLVLRKERCQGCTHCTRACPTEAIRIRDGKAEVMPHRCVQCGRCIQVCPRGAWEMRSDSLEKVKREGEALAVLDSTVFWQFGGQTSPQAVAEAFLEIGFSAVQDLGEALRIYAAAVSRYLSSRGRPFPAIGSACPAVVQLVQVKYPSLLENLVPILSPLKIMASRPRDIGRGILPKHSYYIVPCLAQAGAASEPPAKGKRFYGAISLTHVFNPLKAILSRKGAASGNSSGREPSASAMKWAAAGGESEALGTPGSLVVDGIPQVAHVLELAESGLLGDVPFIEAWACTAGCLGGPLTIQDPFLARYHLLAWVQNNKGRVRKADRGKVSVDLDRFRLSRPVKSRGGMRLDEDLKVAIDKLRRIDEVVKKLPGIDCGSCGCPNCLALAEDIVQGHAMENDCLYILKKTVSKSRGKNLSRWQTPKKRDLES
jgi:Na+-translocating ferredoxin:NAD+ oxidoreductase RNF subunit RnfB